MRPVFCLVSLLLAFSGALTAGDLVPDCSGVSGWSQKGEVRSFVPDDLFDYINGNAEGYIIYGFEKMTGVTCVSGEESVLIDISRMESAELAFGIFSANRHPRFEVAKIGAAGQLMPRKATFVKGRYYVELASRSDAPEILEAFVKAFEPAVPGTIDPPATLGWFPEEGLDPDSVRLIPQSVLGLRMLKRGYIAQYDDGRSFIVAEDSPDTAAALMGKLKDRLSEVQEVEVGDEALTGKDRFLGLMCVARKGSYVVGSVTRKEADIRERTVALVAKVP
jgi:hypothetical protein